AYDRRGSASKLCARDGKSPVVAFLPSARRRQHESLRCVRLRMWYSLRDSIHFAILYLADPHLFPAYARAASPSCSLLANGTAWDEICCNPPPVPEAIEGVLFFRRTQVSSDLK